MQLLTTFTSFLKSRQKVLIKRRKVQLKNRPVSKRRLKQQQKVMNISYEMKLVNIKQQLDRKKSQNHHINEIVQELFYPEVKLSNEQEVDLRVKQLDNKSSLYEDGWEESSKFDQLAQRLRSVNLPLDLLGIHQQRWKEFLPKHYEQLFMRLSYYCFKRDKIKARMMENWDRLIKKMQEKEGKPKPTKCPYLFLEKEQITRHEHWGSLMREIHRKLTQIKDISTFNQYLPILFALQKSFNSIPADIYQLVLTRNSLAKYQELDNLQISNMIKFMKYKNRVKYDPHIKIAQPEKEQQEVNLNHFARKLATSIINNPQQFTKDDFMNIFIVINTSKKRMNLLTQQLLTKSQSIISSILSELSFENVATYLTIYALFNKKPNIEFLEILKYDLYRKCSSQTNYHPLLLLMNNIKQRRLTFKNYRPKGISEEIISLEGYDLLVKVAESISKLINRLKPQQLIQLLNSCFNNDLRHPSVIEIISTEFVKHRKEYGLQTLAKGFFKISLLGHKSKILTKCVFDEFLKRYHDQAKKYKEQDNFLLPTEDNQQAQVLNFKQIHLQQCLVMMIWGLTNQLGTSLKSQINLDNLLTLIPIKLESIDPLVVQLASNINNQLQTYSFFPKIQWLFVPNTFPEGRLREFYKPAFAKDETQLLMWEESRFTNKFIQNYNFEQNMFLSQRWSSTKVYGAEDYLKFCLQSITSPEKVCYFDRSVLLPAAFIEKRNKVVQDSKSKANSNSKFFSKGTNKKEGEKKMYDLYF